MDCDNQEIEATKTIGSTDIEKVLKKLKNKHTKESIILLDYISKLEKANKILNKSLAVANKLEIEIKKKYVSKDKIKETKNKIHKLLDTNGITRAYQIEIDEVLEDLLKE